jgi:hypothetical protein
MWHVVGDEAECADGVMRGDLAHTMPVSKILFFSITWEERKLWRGARRVRDVGDHRQVSRASFNKIC